MIRYFLLTAVPEGRLLAETASWLALARVIDGYLALRMGLMDEAGADAWRVAIVNHLIRFKAAYGDHTKPKHHLALHLPEQLRRFRRLQCTFTMERKHKTFKRHAKMWRTSGSLSAL